MGCGVLAIAVGLTGLVITQGAGSPSPGLEQVPVVRAPAGPVSALPAPTAATRPVARPLSLIIPAIGVRTRLVRLGITAAGTLQVPSATAVAGWFTRSPRPGATGSSIIVGHVDSYRGPGVFYRLKLLRSPERIYVRRADGTLAVFRVTSVDTYLKSRFPAAAVYGPAAGPQLRLITCGGTFDSIRRSYLSNVVVFAVGIGRIGRSAPRRPPGAHRTRRHRRPTVPTRTFRLRPSLPAARVQHFDAATGRALGRGRLSVEPNSGLRPVPAGRRPKPALAGRIRRSGGRSARRGQGTAGTRGPDAGLDMLAG